MQAVIMAGGKGTRLRSITNDEIPKPMAPIAGKPILQWQVEALRRGGVTDVILVVGHLGEKIEEFFGDGSAFGVDVSYYREEQPLGTAGALAELGERLEETFLLVFGDTIFDISIPRMLAFHREKEALATLFVHPNSHPFDSDIVLRAPDGRVRELLSKHEERTGWYDNCVNAGFYIVQRELCARIPKGEKTDLEKQLLWPTAKGGGKIYAYLSPEYIKDVGTPERIAVAEEELRTGVVAARNLERPQRCVFLDRDGTVNQYRGLVSRPEQLELEENAAEAIRRLNRSGYLAIIVTNQPVVARGMCSMEDVERIHDKLKTLLGQEGVYVDDIRFCPHHPDKGYPEENPAYKIPCRCRKPDIGMLADCASAYHIDLERSWMVGDTTMDIQTGKNAGTRTALVLTGQAGQDGKYAAAPDVTGKDLLDAVEQILKESEETA